MAHHEPQRAESFGSFLAVLELSSTGSYRMIINGTTPEYPMGFTYNGVAYGFDAAVSILQAQHAKAFGLKDPNVEAK